MEIPIQVAVRVCPCAISPSSSNNNDENNDNINNNENQQQQQQQQDSSSSCCIQIIPISPIYSPNNNNHHNDNGNHDGGDIINNSIASGIVQIGTNSFPITHPLPIQCSQSQIYHQTVYPLISLFLEGFDASVVTYGQKSTGKSYTLYGPGFDCVYGESEHGIVQRCVREIFSQLSNHRERNFIINIGWVEICGDEIRDLLEAGNVPCNSISDVFHWIQIGMTNRSIKQQVHNLFTITLEQQWISTDGLIQHRLSTASFCDLCGTERIYLMNNNNNNNNNNNMDQQQQQHISIPKDLGLQALEKIVTNLTDPTLIYNDNNIHHVQYNQTTLTTLLKDSFGGRAQTLLILCVSPYENDINETIFNLQFAFKAQCVRNYVIMNTFSDNNTPISPDIIQPSTTDINSEQIIDTTFGLQFAATQWLKLVSNAEGLFSKLINSKILNDSDKEQIEEWLFLKQECEECLSSSEINDYHRSAAKQLGPIQEIDEPASQHDEITYCSDDQDTSLQQNSDNESDSELQHPDLIDKIENLMDELRLKTDNLVNEKYQEYLKSQPKAVMESIESFKPDERRASSSLGGRRRSIQPGATLSSAEIAMLNRVASREQMITKSSDDFLIENSTDINHHPLNNHRSYNSPIENVQKKLRKIITDIEAKQRQIKELEHTVAEKKGLLNDLNKNKATRTNAEQRFKKKRDKIEANYEKTKKQLSKAVVNGKNKSEIERLKVLTSHFEQRLQDLQSIKHITADSDKKFKKLEQSMHESKKQLENLQKTLKKEKKIKDQLENELKLLKEKENANTITTGAAGIGTGTTKNTILDEKVSSSKNLKQVQARISHLDHVLKEKSHNLEQFDGDGEEKESLRHEIRNLRRTRDHLIEQRCQLDRKLKKEKILSYREERKLLECDEAIEAIDAAIEFKNELICGHKSIDTNEKLQREKGEQMLMARLNKLSLEEMRTLLYKYFTKVIDLRDSSRKLEIQLMNLERERDTWEWRERVLSNAIRQARLEGERNAVLLQRQHETKLTLMLRHLANETSLSSSSFSDKLATTNIHHNPAAIAANAFAAAAAATTVAQTTTTTTSNTSPTSPISPLSSYHYNTDTDFDFDNITAYKSTSAVVAAAAAAKHLHQLKSSKHHNHNTNSGAAAGVTNLDICPLTNAITKYKPLDKIKEKDRESKQNKLFAKFQVLTRYHSGNNNGNNGDSGTMKSLQDTALIPEENLKKLQINSPSATKVTRQKNKIIIQDSSSRKN